MFTRLSTAFVIILGLTALVDAGIVPAARAVGDLHKRSNALGNYAEPDLYAEPLGKREIGVGNYAEPDLHAEPLGKREIAVGNYAEPDLYAEPVTRDPK
ncbi:hypothetical protein DEU56DRAFT_523998 [Suillus clintonianus]|uniref:uncharacterized protein n=1 Tax=Suillus clintonianus TaxID=1904413 RepID=UPI001B86C6CA|nr:uncharacterized protein DEU56DRAFT_523998 [Suillus clintonianus]KAG2127962.1 hypothetical protein DEU56DRAFT_523998 [Suillus clintonianus]